MKLRQGNGTKRLVYGALMLACAVLLPQVFHLTGGPALGATFLPMHIPVLISGLLLGPLYGTVIGLTAPALSFLATGMPSAERLPFMMAELFVYGFACGFLSVRTKRIYPALLSSMVLGRLAYAVSLAIAFYLLNMKETAPAAAWGALIKGLPGILLQIAIIPPVVYALRRYNLEGNNAKSKKAAQ
jgi:niacin transporter